MLTVNLAEQRCFADICVIVRFVLETGIVLVGRYVTDLLFDAAVELERATPYSVKLLRIKLGRTFLGLCNKRIVCSLSIAIAFQDATSKMGHRVIAAAFVNDSAGIRLCGHLHFIKGIVHEHIFDAVFPIE